MNNIIEAMARAHFKSACRAIQIEKNLEKQSSKLRMEEHMRAAIRAAIEHKGKSKMVAALKEHLNGGQWTWEGAVNAVLSAMLEESE